VAATAGAQTRIEILSQPRCWAECFRALEAQDALRLAGRDGSLPPDWLFIGCGSSYYVGLGAAASWTALTGLPARAAPASELLLFPELLLAAARPCQPVLISRSGHTSEVLKVAEQLELRHNLRTLAISCVTHQPLEEICAATLYLLPADEQSLVMTRSFTSMLLALQALAAERGRQEEFAAALRRLPEQTTPCLEAWAGRIEQFVAAHEFADYVFLGQGPFYAVASEAMLKVKEMSCSYAQCFHTLEFRHGPKAIVSPQTLVTFLLSERGHEAEREVLEDVKGLGGVTLVVTNRADAATRQAADLLVELNLEVPEYARLAAYALPGQLLGLFTGLKKGFDPDRPRNLSRAVILNGNFG
jgi:glucosamine--fructose-6-phosphate aminotransferase (isomerizing)